MDSVYCDSVCNGYCTSRNYGAMDKGFFRLTPPRRKTMDEWTVHHVKTSIHGEQYTLMDGGVTLLRVGWNDKQILNQIAREHNALAKVKMIVDDTSLHSSRSGHENYLGALRKIRDELAKGENDE